jgi:hypothetical protein
MSKPPRPAPLERATRRIAPFVACHLIGFAEALDSLMAMEFARNPWKPDQFANVHGRYQDALNSQIEACPPELLAKYQRHAAACAKGVASVRERRDSHRPAMETPAG